MMRDLRYTQVFAASGREPHPNETAREHTGLEAAMPSKAERSRKPSIRCGEGTLCCLSAGACRTVNPVIGHPVPIIDNCQWTGDY
jgi:hypothetical protein